VIELQEEVARLRVQLLQAQQEAREAVDRIHRQYRRDLVPMRQTPAPYRGRR
jgi:hypothetical protein